MKLLPEETLVLVRTPNASELFTRFRDTSLGRMVRDPQLAPLIEKLYGSAGDLYTEKVAETLGVSWEELQNLPQAEVAFAIVARRDFQPSFILLVDQGEAPSVASRLLERGIEAAKEDGAEPTIEKIEGVDVTVLRDGDDQDKMVGVFEKDNTIVAATDPQLIREILLRWNGEGGAVPSSAEAAAEPEAKTPPADGEAASDETAEDVPRQYSGRSLAENQKFVSILRHCRRPHDPPPQMILFADPVGLFRNFGRDNAGLAFTMATFPALGVDGLAGIGGTMTFATERFDGLSHLHVLLDNPRAGVMQAIAFEPGETTPEPWVFADLETYFTWNWNLKTTLNTIRSLVDMYVKPEGRVDKSLQEFADEVGIHPEFDIIDNIAGRFHWMIAYERPSRMRGQQSTMAIKVVDEAKAKETLAKFVAKYSEKFEEREFGGVKYFSFIIDWPEELKDDPPTAPFIAVTDGHLFFGGSGQLFERAIEARDGTVERLADRPDYQQLAIEVQQEASGVTPALWMYHRPEESLRQWYDLLTSDKAREFLEKQAEGNPFFAALLESLDAKELPPFEVIAPYWQPSVGVIYDTDTGYHGISFTVRSDTAPAP